MNASDPPIKDICEAYGVTRQRLHQLRQRQGFTVQDFREPDFIFQRLLTTYASRLRKRLSNPAAREAIKQALQ